MKKLIAALAASVLLLVSMAGTAVAQEPTGVLEINPTTVDEAGEHQFTLGLSGFTPGLALFVLPCTAPAGGDMSAFDAAADCDTANLTPVVADDNGNGTVTNTYTVTDDGLVVVAGDAAQTEFGIVIVPPPGADAAADDAGDDGGELAETGVETGLLAVIATTMVAGGAMVVRQTRKY